MDIHELLEDGYNIQLELERIKQESIKPLQDRLLEVNKQVLAYFQDKEISTQDTKFGKVKLLRRTSVQTPKDMGDKRELFDWLKSQGDEFFWDSVGVNSQTLNRIYKDALEEAEMNDIDDFELPGVGSPKMSFTISYPRKRRSE